MLSAFWPGPILSIPDLFGPCFLLSSQICYWIAPLVLLPSYFLYSALKSGVQLAMKSSTLCWPMWPALLPNLAVSTWEGHVQDNLSRVMEQVGWRTTCPKYDTVQCHRKWTELRANWQIWILTLPFNDWVNELGKPAELYDKQGALPVQYCLLWKHSTTYKSIKTV